jgi:hypothetical protein
MPCRTLSLALVSAALGVAALTATPATADYISMWDSGSDQAWHDHYNGASGGYANWNGEPGNAPPEVVAGAVLVCPMGYTLGPDQVTCWPH